VSAPIDIVRASAGTGKTHHLTERLIEALVHDDPRARPEGVMAITYTRRAATELQSRVRKALIHSGQFELAARLRDGYLGTVHATCDRILREFALEAGLSPSLRPLGEAMGKRLLDQAIGEVLLEAGGLGIDAIAQRLSLPDWHHAVKDLVSHARGNALGPKDLEESGARSLAGMQALLRTTAAPDPSFIQDLVAPLKEASVRLQWSNRLRPKILAALRAVEADKLPPWGTLVELVQLIPQRNSETYLPALIASVERHLSHPNFHADIAGMIRGVTGLASRALAEYARQKREAQVVDYDDMLAETLVLLDHPVVATALGERLDLLLVDEFQDTTPIQLAILLRLAALARRTVWVGDPKQAIYSFQGSDPELMAAALRHTRTTGQVLERSYRSRPELVRLCSAIFVAAFRPWGLAPGEVRLMPNRQDVPGLQAEPAVELWAWRTEAWSRTAEACAIADGIAALLRDRVPVEVNGEVRPAERGDIAVLCRINTHCVRVASALANRGIAARVRLGGLFGTPETWLVRAALAVVHDPEAGVPALEVAWLLGKAAEDPDAFLARRLDEVEVTPGAPPFSNEASIEALRSLAAETVGRSPVETFDRVLATLDLLRVLRAWPDGARRVANLEAMRAEIVAFEEQCALEHTPCTLGPLLAHLAEQARGERDDDRVRAGDEQAMPTDDQAVTVTTVHQSKGLEWPIVVLGSLDYRFEPSPFRVVVEPAAEFDPRRPLADRRVRYWPNPYGRVEGTTLAQRAAATPEAAKELERHHHEELRLLYVGFTRARDRLVLPIENRGGNWRKRWLERLGEGYPVLGLPLGPDGPIAEDENLTMALPNRPAPPSVARIVVAGDDPHEVPCLVRRVDPGVARSRMELAPGGWVAARRPPIVDLDAIQPSDLDIEDPAIEVLPPDPLAGRLPLRTRVEDFRDVGDAIHGFLAADHPALPDRLAAADRWRTDMGVEAAIEGESMLRMGDALRAWVERRHPGATWLREWPVRWLLRTERGPRLMVGEIDLVLDTPLGMILVDHKAFPGEAAERDLRARAHAGQLLAYRAALEDATGRTVIGMYLHFPLRGEIQELRAPVDVFYRAIGARRRQPAAPADPRGQLSLF
jgi:ATP-dependent helicase/nuclease subunit A